MEKLLKRRVDFSLASTQNGVRLMLRTLFNMIFFLLEIHLPSAFCGRKNLLLSVWSF